MLGCVQETGGEKTGVVGERALRTTMRAVCLGGRNYYVFFTCARSWTIIQPSIQAWPEAPGPDSSPQDAPGRRGLRCHRDALFIFWKYSSCGTRSGAGSSGVASKAGRHLFDAMPDGPVSLRRVPSRARWPPEESRGGKYSRLRISVEEHFRRIELGRVPVKPHDVTLHVPESALKGGADIQLGIEQPSLAVCASRVGPCSGSTSC